MTDFNTEPAPQGDPTTTAPAAEPDYKALWEREKTDRQTERARYRPIEQALGALPEEQQRSILSLAEAAANGDVDTIRDWSAATYRNVTGADIANAVAARVNEPTSSASTPAQPAAATPDAALTPQQVQEMIRRESEAVVQREALVTQIKAELSTAGYPADSPSGQTIIAYAQANRVPIADAIAWYDSDLQSQYARRAQVLGQTAGAVPPPSPTGAPAASQPQGTPGQRAIARLTGQVGA